MQVHKHSEGVTSLAAWSRRTGAPSLPDVAKIGQDEADYRKRLGRVIVQLREVHGVSQATLASSRAHAASYVIDQLISSFAAHVCGTLCWTISPVPATANRNSPVSR